MNILLITHIFPPAIDGGSRVIFKLGEYFKKNKNNSILYLTSKCFSTDDFVNPKSSNLQINNSIGEPNIIRLSVYKHLRRPLKLVSLLLPKNSFLRQLLEVFQKGPIFKVVPFVKALFLIYQFKPNIIIAGPLPTTIVIYAQILSKIFKTKIIINASFHQTDTDFFKKPLINILKTVDYIWSLTEYEKNFFTKSLDIDPKKIILAGNGVDSNSIINPKSIKYPLIPNILFIGSLAAHKKVGLLLNSFSLLFKKYPKITLTIAGQKTLYYPQIESVYSQLDPKIKKNIKFIFNFSPYKLNQIIDSCTCLVLPSIQESFGLVLIETMARGKPFVCSDIPPLKEMINKTKAGISFKQNSSTELSSILKKLLDDNKLCSGLGINGLKYVEKHYTWENIGQIICQKISS